MDTYDYIIAGGGCAGLSLAYYLHREGLNGRRVLIIDREQKSSNDRTWCFWTDRPTEFDALIHKRWNCLAFADKGGEIVSNLGDRQYQMLRSIDFYRFIREKLKSSSQIEWLQASISTVNEDEKGAYVVAGGRRIRARYVFNSCFQISGLRTNAAPHHFLLQHFQGWIIRSKRPVFDSGKALLMDFRTEQKGAARFFYVLPLSTRRALVEFTVFSEDLLPEEAYGQALDSYIRHQLRVGEYAVEETEGGAIPMTDMPFPPQQSPHIINIGTAGGAVKPTTGYAFLRIQDQTRFIARQVLRNRLPLTPAGSARRFAFYDSLLLRILKEEGDQAASIFSRLFRRNSMHNILTFLDERTSLWQEGLIFANLPMQPFLRALWKVYLSGSNRRQSLQPRPAESSVY